MPCRPSCYFSWVPLSCKIAADGVEKGIFSPATIILAICVYFIDTVSGNLALGRRCCEVHGVMSSSPLQCEVAVRMRICVSVIR